MKIPAINQNYLIEVLQGLLNTPSPTGFAHMAVNYMESKLSEFPGLEITRTRKGALLAALPGARSEGVRAVASHVDTLGAMVKEIKTNGRLKLTQVGGYAWDTVENESVRIFTRDGKEFIGTIILGKASTHVYGKEVSELKRDEDTLEVRLDERTESEEETRALGIEVGDFVSLDPRVVIHNGFIRSRHLDDKACAACMLAAVQALQNALLIPRRKVYFYFSNYEEVGHGGSSGIPEEVTELLVTDMAAVGEGQTSDEYHTTICVKDSSGPYDHDFSLRLRSLAEAHDIDFKVDIYPYYGSDGSMYWRSGGSGVVALIGPGVGASHNYERTHVDALIATTQWILAYLLSD
ncbi:MAG: M42 family metallopeptidase [Anaerolineaceae bacterium]|nr:M42 family metallopeptidase [Anaerolineaceae bacterium]